ncbi:MAG: NUDIX hydrolase [Bacilli bacterium]
MKDNLIVETLIGIFTVDHSNPKILLVRKKVEPYKGYWTLLGNDLNVNETLENNITDVVIEQAGLSNISIEQCHCFSNIDRSKEERKIAIAFIGLIDSKTIELKQINNNNELGWFNINDIPKTGYDHDTIIKYIIENLRKKLMNSNALKILFPSDFTLPELQKVYEKILDKSLDRRNFRKKFITLDLIEDTGYKNEGFNGRPAKLYRFKEQIKEKELF